MTWPHSCARCPQVLPGGGSPRPGTKAALTCETKGGDREDKEARGKVGEQTAARAGSLQFAGVSPFSAFLRGTARGEGTFAQLMFGFLRSSVITSPTQEAQFVPET